MTPAAKPPVRRAARPRRAPVRVATRSKTPGRSVHAAKPGAGARGLGAGVLGVGMALASAGIASVHPPAQGSAAAARVRATSTGSGSTGSGSSGSGSSGSGSSGRRGSLPSVLVVPDATLHPGVASTMTQAEVCDPAFHTDTVRPPTSYTNRLKLLMFGDAGGDITGPSGTTYHVTGEGLPGVPADYELDHLISLQLGGDPEDPKNLWMEPWEKKGDKLAAPGQGAESKDVLEGRLHREVCKAGTLTLDEAQQEIASDWTAAD